jgi:hypothetical protein
MYRPYVFSPGGMTWQSVHFAAYACAKGRHRVGARRADKKKGCHCDCGSRLRSARHAGYTTVTVIVMLS